MPLPLPIPPSFAKTSFAKTINHCAGKGRLKTALTIPFAKTAYVQLCRKGPAA